MENLQVGNLVITLSKTRAKTMGEKVEIRLPNGEVIVVAITQLSCNQVKLLFQSNRNIKIKRVYGKGIDGDSGEALTSDADAGFEG